MIAALLLAAAGASALTLVSGFGLGTLLMPVFALFFPVETAIALTAAVHLANNLFKLALYGKKADGDLVLRFGLPALLAAFAGARLLAWLSVLPPLWTYAAFGREWTVLPVKFAAGLLMAAFALLELRPAKPVTGRGVLVAGGLLSGFFGGLTGHQGALRSAFLAKAGMTKQAFVGTGVAVACLVDAARLFVYGARFQKAAWDHAGLLAAACLAAFAGVFLGGKLLEKTTMAGIQKLVAALLLLMAAGLASGLL